MLMPFSLIALFSLFRYFRAGNSDKIFTNSETSLLFLLLRLMKPLLLFLKRLSLLLICVSYFLFSSLIAFSEESGCINAATAWITELNSSNSKILQSHCQENCRFASSWVKKISHIEEPKRRERTCNDLVLIWSHKECIYFRDYVDASAYYPCKSWTRQMFQQCMAGNTEWFLEN